MAPSFKHCIVKARKEKLGKNYYNAPLNLSIFNNVTTSVTECWFCYFRGLLGFFLFRRKGAFFKEILSLTLVKGEWNEKLSKFLYKIENTRSEFKKKDYLPRRRFSIVSFISLCLCDWIIKPKEMFSDSYSSLFFLKIHCYTLTVEYSHFKKEAYLAR